MARLYWPRPVRRPISTLTVVRPTRLATIPRRRPSCSAASSIAGNKWAAGKTSTTDTVEGIYPAHKKTGLGGRFFRVFGDGDAGAAFFSEFFALGNEVRVWPQGFGCSDAHIHAQFGADHQQRVAHVVARIAEVGVADFMHRLVAVLAHGQYVGDHLRRVEFSGQAVEHRHASELGQLFDDFLFKATVLDGVEHPAQHTGGVFHAFFVADLRRHRVDVGDVGTLVVGRDFEGATGAGRGFFEDQRDVLALQVWTLGAGVFGAFEVPGQVDQVVELASGVVHQAQQAAVAHVKSHDLDLLGFRLSAGFALYKHEAGHKN